MQRQYPATAGAPRKPEVQPISGRPERRPRRRLDGFRPNPKAKLLDQCREVMRCHHFSYRTEKTYVDWIRRLIVFQGKRHPREMGKEEINRLLSDLAVAGPVGASTQNQALHSLPYLYQGVPATEGGVIPVPCLVDRIE